MYSNTHAKSVPARTLMHPIEAMNHRKNGFFPTDFDTVDFVLEHLIPSEQTMNILDPCCGEGEALARLAKSYPKARTFGVELDEKRCSKASSILNEAHCADVYDVSFGRGQFDLLFLNPPYGNDMSDKFSSDKTERLEHKFLTKTFASLKPSGVLVYIVPINSIDEPRMQWLLSRFKDITIRRAAVDTYKQVFVIGTKLKQQRSVNKKMIEDFKTQKMFFEQNQNIIRYKPPKSTHHAKMRINRLSVFNVSELRQSFDGQWAYFDSLFGDANLSEFKQPMHSLSDWHLALLITSGAVQGIVDNGNSRLMIKGATKKSKSINQSKEANNDTEEVITTFESKDRFSAQIKAINIDLCSPNFGEIITIR